MRVPRLGGLLLLSAALALTLVACGDDAPSDTGSDGAGVTDDGGSGTSVPGNEPAADDGGGMNEDPDVGGDSTDEDEGTTTGGASQGGTTGDPE